MRKEQAELTVRKSNDFILSKYKVSNALEAKLIAISLTRLEIRDGKPQASISSNELKEMLNIESKSCNIYTQLKTASKNMISKGILIDKDGEFVAFSMFSKCWYKDGVFTMVYNDFLTDYVFNLKKNFTSYGLVNILGLESAYSCRMYELLKKEAFKITEKTPVVIMEYSLPELKSLLGILDIAEDVQESMLKRGATWDEIEAAANRNQMSIYSNFKKRVLERAMEELKQSSDICFTYEPIFGGRGGKVRSIRFNIMKNEPDANLPETILIYVGHNGLTEKDIKVLYEEAGEDENRVISAISQADEQTNIKNYVGWIRTCIREGFSEPIETLRGSAERAVRVRAVMSQYEEEKKDDNSQMYINAWDKIKSRSDQFDKFLETVALPLDLYEQFTSPRERVEEYIAWSKGEELRA